VILTRVRLPTFGSPQTLRKRDHTGRCCCCCRFNFSLWPSLNFILLNPSLLFEVLDFAAVIIGPIYYQFLIVNPIKRRTDNYEYDIKVDKDITFLSDWYLSLEVQSCIHCWPTGGNGYSTHCPPLAISGFSSNIISKPQLQPIICVTIVVCFWFGQIPFEHTESHNSVVNIELSITLEISGVSSNLITYPMYTNISVRI